MHSTVNPSWENPEKFVLEIFFKDLELPEMKENKVTIARIDNKSHGGCHIDKEYKNPPEKEHRDWNFFEAWDYLQKRWEKYCRKYFRNYQI